MINGQIISFDAFCLSSESYKLWVCNDLTPVKRRGFFMLINRRFGDAVGFFCHFSTTFAEFSASLRFPDLHLAGGSSHEDREYSVAGIFEVTNTVLDLLILTNLESAWETHNHAVEEVHEDIENIPGSSGHGLGDHGLSGKIQESYGGYPIAPLGQYPNQYADRCSIL